MAGRIQLKPHLTTEELLARYRTCQKPQEKVRWHALYLIARGTVAAEAARRVGRASAWMTRLARRYNHKGASAVTRRQSTTPSHRTKVEADVSQELAKALRAPAPDGGLWTAPKVAAWITDKGGQPVHQTTAWRVMRRLGFSLQAPRPANQRRATAEEQAEFKKR